MTIPSMDYSIPGLAELINDLADYPKLANRHLMRAMKQATITIESAIKPLVPVGVSSRLKNSIGSEVEDHGAGSIVGRVGSSLKSEVYPQVMEFGRAPGTGVSEAGIEQLTRWVHVKRITGVYSVKTHARTGNKRTQADEDRAMAFAIARAIKARGIKARGFMKAGFEKSQSKVDGYFIQALEGIVQELANGG